MKSLHAQRRAASCTLGIGVGVFVAACGDNQSAREPNAATAAPPTAAPQVIAGSGAGTRAASAGTAAISGSKSGSAAPSPTTSPTAAMTASAGSIASAGSTAAAGGSSAAAGSSATGASGAAVAAAGSGGMDATGQGGQPGQPAVECDPADKTAEPEVASFKLLGGYQSMAMAPTTGPATPVIEVHAGFADWTVYRPELLASENPHEIMIWANGGCLQNSTIQGHFLLELASWGFVVVADGYPQDNNSGGDPAAGGIRPGPEAAPMVEAMDWITAENDRPCSPFYRKLDVTKIATGGQSCGGMMTMLSAGDKRVTMAMVFNSGTSGNEASLFATYHAPMLFLAGGSSDFLSGSATSNVNAIDNVPIFYGNLQVGHGGTWEATNGGEMGRVALGWMKWKLQADSSFEDMFVGTDCELCKSPSEWTVVKKMMD